MTREELAAVARAWMTRLWKERDLDAVDALHDPAFVDRSPAGRGSDRAQYRAGVADLFATFPDFDAVTDGLVVDEEASAVAIRWTATATRAPDERITFRGIEILRVVDGRITERWGEWDGGDAAAPALVLLVLSGVPGTGKSTLGDRLGRRLRLPVLSVDPLESAILSAGIAQGFATGLAAYKIAEALATAQLARGQSVILDAVNAVEPARDTWRRLAATHGAALVVVECRCSDEAVHRERLLGRRRHLDPAFRHPTWDDVVARRSSFRPWPEPALVLDAVESLEVNLDRALQWVDQAGRRVSSR